MCVLVGNHQRQMLNCQLIDCE